MQNILASLMAIFAAMTGIGNTPSLPPGIANHFNGTANVTNNKTHDNFGSQVSAWAHQNPKPTINGTFGGWVSVQARLYHQNGSGNQTGNQTGNPTGNTTSNESVDLPRIPAVNLRSGISMPSLLPTLAVGRSPALDTEPTGTVYPTPPGQNNGNRGNSGNGHSTNSNSRRP